MPQLQLPDKLSPFVRCSNTKTSNIFMLLFMNVDAGSNIILYEHLTNSVNFFSTWKMSDSMLLTVVRFCRVTRPWHVGRVVGRIFTKETLVVSALNFDALLKKVQEDHGDAIYEPRIEQESQDRFDYELFLDYAVSHQATNADSLVYDYVQLVGCKDGKDSEHATNAARYLFDISDRGMLARRAVRFAVERRAEALRIEHPRKFLMEKGDILTSQLIGEPDETFGLADFYRRHVVCDFGLIARCVFDAFTRKIDCARYVVLRGKTNSGKTLLAAAFLRFFEGIIVNVNVRPLNFCKRVALDKRFVLFDHVKGDYVLSDLDSLSKSTGFQCLDEIRDLLDGTLGVFSESHKFPPGIITCNDYEIPLRVLDRVKLFRMDKSFYFEHHPIKLTEKLLYVACVLEGILWNKSWLNYRQKARRWWQQHDEAACPCGVRKDEKEMDSFCRQTFNKIL